MLLLHNILLYIFLTLVSNIVASDSNSGVLESTSCDVNVSFREIDIDKTINVSTVKQLFIEHTTLWAYRYYFAKTRANLIQIWFW